MLPRRAWGGHDWDWDGDTPSPEGSKAGQGHQEQAGVKAWLVFHIMILALSVPRQGKEGLDHAGHRRDEG